MKNSNINFEQVVMFQLTNENLVELEMIIYIREVIM